MISIARDILWRTLFGNPILLRIISMAGKRRRDMLIRCGYLGLLCLWIVFSLLALADQTDLGELAKRSASIFKNISFIQLLLVALLAPVFTAGAISQEGDAQTYDILLATPLSNAQIVLGSLLSRVFFIIALLLCGIPVFAITQIFGGVGIENILYAFGIAAGTAFLTGAIAIALATFRLGTRRTIFGFYIFVVIYLAGLVLLDRIPFFQIAGGALYADETSHISWFTGLNPFLALSASFGDPAYLPPLPAELPPSLQVWPIRWYLTDPHTFYTAFTFLLGFALTLPSILFLRRMAQSTLTFRTWLLLKLRLTRSATARKPRYVWHNPIAWREAKTKASAARMTWMRYALIAAGLLGAFWTLTRFADVQLPQQYIARGSIDLENGQVTILSGSSSATFRLPENLPVKLGDRSVRIDQLDGRFAVRDYSIDPRRTNVLTALNLAPLQRSLSLEETQSYLLKLLILELAVILIVITNVAASTVTREREDGSLDLLLSSPITSRYYLWGKLRGLLSLAVPLNIVPLSSIAAFVVYDIFRSVAEGSQFRWVIFPEAIILTPLILMTLTAFGGVVGIHMSLRCRRTIVAVMSSVAIVVGVVGVAGLIGGAIASSASREWVPLIFASFSPVTMLSLLASPHQSGGRLFLEGDDSTIAAARLAVCVSSLIASGVYALIICALYRAMVKNFDMTIRRRAGQT